MFLPQSLLDFFPAELRAAFRVFSLSGGNLSSNATCRKLNLLAGDSDEFVALGDGITLRCQGNSQLGANLGASFDAKKRLNIAAVSLLSLPSMD